MTNNQQPTKDEIPIIREVINLLHLEAFNAVLDNNEKMMELIRIRTLGLYALDRLEEKAHG